MPPDHPEIPIIGEEVQIVADGESRKKGIDGMDLNAFLSARSLQGGRLAMVGQIRDDHGNTRKTVDQAFALLRSAESLQQFLDDDSRCEQQIATLDALLQDSDSLTSGASRRKAIDHTLVSTRVFISSGDWLCSRSQDPSRDFRRAR